MWNRTRYSLSLSNVGRYVQFNSNKNLNDIRKILNLLYDGVNKNVFHFIHVSVKVWFYIEHTTKIPGYDLDVTGFVKT